MAKLKLTNVLRNHAIAPYASRTLTILFLHSLRRLPRPCTRAHAQLQGDEQSAVVLKRTYLADHQHGYVHFVLQ